MSHSTHHLQARWLLAGCLLFSGLACADEAPAALPPALQQQLLDAQKQVLGAETRLVEEKIRNQRSEHEAFVKNESTLFTYTTVGLVAGIVIGWLSFLLMAQKWIRDQVSQEIEGNIKHLTRIVDNSRLENLIKEKTRLLVLHQPGQHTDLHLELRNTGFLLADAMPCPDSPQDFDWKKDYDQLVFDNIDENTLLTFVNERDSRMYFAYTSGRYQSLPPNKVAIANSKMTLYSRLMESLTWQYWQTGKAA